MEEYGRVTITPIGAERMLKHANKNNRRISSKVVRTYAHDMKTGKWDEGSCSPIVFNEDGILVDGHHRLHAVIKAGVPVKMLVVTGASRDSSLYDRGKLRSTSDILKMRGNVSDGLISSNAISTAKYVLRGLFNIDRPSDSMIEEFLERYGDTVMQAVKICRYGANPIGKAAPFCSACFCALMCGVDPEHLEDFFVSFNSGMQTDIMQTSPIVLRNQYLKIRRGRSQWLDTDARLHLFNAAQEAIADYEAYVSRRLAYKGKAGVYGNEIKAELQKTILHEDI